jgi:outer membrane biosynthesis protein TonB
MSPSRNLTSSRNSAILRVGGEVEDRTPFGAGAVVSVLFHAGIIAATIFTFQHARLDIADESPPVVPVDLVTIADKTNIMATVKEEPKLKQEQIQEAKLEPTPPTLPSVQEKSELAPSDQAASEPILPKKQPTPVPKAKPQPPQEQPKKKQSEDSLNALLNNLTSPSTAPKNARVASRTQRGFGDQSAMTMDLADAISNKIAQCWSPPVGAPRSQELVVDFDLFLNEDGTVASASSDDLHSNDPYTRAAADAARRAIFTCAPYQLPRNRYAQWHEINPFHFDPSRMMGQ